ncbi:hypothetical protein [Sphingomonas prati]|uniref:Uncharacterized protein n=1 Tax=Sphingomonas prati TaxID=1843237 RepID=A0A7W9BR41_9SPHN|nr:hypothetical protein [Sphingomonas prati]MBB5728616.1 hypothetical protein [Sphingomonas prati]GGE72379.1 hypothetical protein GCM10011404_01110 [Sphingomonas prati]
MKPILGLAAMLVLATPAVAQRPVANPFSDKLASLKDIPRRAVLRRAILDSNLWCDRVSQDLRRGTWRNLSVWNARCGRGADYGVFIGQDQSVQVRPCKDLASLKLPRCALPPRAVVQNTGVRQTR